MAFPIESQGITRQPVERNTAPHNPTADEYVQFVLASFAVSQASKSLQGFVYDHYKLSHPEWELTEELDVLVSERISGRALQITSGKGHRTQGSHAVNKELRDQSRERLKRFKNSEYAAENADELYREIAGELILIDFHYLCLVNGRPSKPTENTPYNPYHDPRLSYVAYFALEKNADGQHAHTTNFEEVNVLYQAVGTLIERGDDLGSVSLPEILYRYQGDVEIGFARRKLTALGVPIEGNLVQVNDLLLAAKQVHDNRPL